MCVWKFCRMDIKFHYICETVLPAVLRIYRKLIVCKVLSHTLFLVLSLSKRCCVCSLRVFLLPSLSLSHAWLEALALRIQLLLFTALLVLSFTPGLHKLFTALSFSSLESSGSSQLESIPYGGKFPRG